MKHRQNTLPTEFAMSRFTHSLDHSFSYATFTYTVMAVCLCLSLLVLRAG